MLAILVGGTLLTAASSTQQITKHPVFCRFLYVMQVDTLRGFVTAQIGPMLDTNRVHEKKYTVPVYPVVLACWSVPQRVLDSLGIKRQPIGE